MAGRPLVLVLFAAALGFWVYQYHRELARLFPGYVISPGGAIARVLIPIYHYWGFWNVWDTAQKHFDSSGARTSLISIRSVLVVFYANWIATGLLKYVPAIQTWLWFDLTVQFLDVAAYFAVLGTATRALNAGKMSAKTPGLIVRGDASSSPATIAALDQTACQQFAGRPFFAVSQKTARM